jgi:hypothetical protein
MQSRLLVRYFTNAAIVAITATGAHAQARGVVADSARQVIGRAAEQLGGMAALSGVRTLRQQYVTHWFRPSFEPNASGVASAGSLELNVDTRDYTRPAWRQFRGNIASGTTGPAITNVVTDSVAMSETPRGPMALNGTYVAERTELFLLAPERLVPALDSIARAGGRVAVRDTMVNGVQLRGVRSSIDGREVTLWVDGGGFPAGVRVRAAQPFDFGLAGFGTMDMDAWYAQWRIVSGVAFPGHVRVLRVGQPYKELFIQSIAVNTPVPADSFAVSDSMRRVFLAEARKPMFDVAIPAIRPDSNGFVTFGPPQVMQGAVRLRSGWMILGTGADSSVMRKALAALGSEKGAVVVTGASVSTASGAPAADSRGLDVFVPRGALGLTLAVYKQQGIRPAHMKTIAGGSWMRVAGDSVWMESLSLPDAPGAVLIWVPRLSWAWIGPFAGPIQSRSALALLDKRGFAATRIGTVRALARTAEEVRRESAGIRP